MLLFSSQGVEDVERVAKEMMRIAGDNEAWRRMVDWKWKGPSVDFMANMDISTVHSSCRLCILIADKIVAKATEGKHETQPCRWAPCFLFFCPCCVSSE